MLIPTFQAMGPIQGDVMSGQEMTEGDGMNVRTAAIHRTENGWSMMIVGAMDEHGAAVGAP